jgi:hypothetical protein
LAHIHAFFFELFSKSRNAWPWCQLQRRFFAAGCACLFPLPHQRESVSRSSPQTTLVPADNHPSAKCHCQTSPLPTCSPGPAAGLAGKAHSAMPYSQRPCCQHTTRQPWNPSPLSFPYPPPLWPSESLRWRKRDIWLKKTNIASVSPGCRPGRRGCASIVHFKLYLKHPS